MDDQRELIDDLVKEIKTIQIELKIIVDTQLKAPRMDKNLFEKFGFYSSYAIPLVYCIGGGSGNRTHDNKPVMLYFPSVSFLKRH